MNGWPAARVASVTPLVACGLVSEEQRAAGACAPAPADQQGSGWSWEWRRHELAAARTLPPAEPLPLLPSLAAAAATGQRRRTGGAASPGMSLLQLSVCPAAPQAAAAAGVAVRAPAAFSQQRLALSGLSQLLRPAAGRPYMALARTLGTVVTAAVAAAGVACS